MNRPMTTKELFQKIRDILKEKGRLPDILDYGLATDKPISIRNCDFELKNNLDYGDNEGIYLNLWIVPFEDGEKRNCGLGIFKTLDRSDEAMHIMADLLADFIIETTSYVNRNQDDFTWEGADVRAFDGNGNLFNWYYSCGSMENALKRKDELLEKYPEVVVRDNATRKEKHFKRQERARTGNDQVTGRKVYHWI